MSERIDMSLYRDYMYEDEYDDSLEAFAGNGREELTTSQEREIEPEAILDETKENSEMENNDVSIESLKPTGPMKKNPRNNNKHSHNPKGANNKTPTHTDKSKAPPVVISSQTPVASGIGRGTPINSASQPTQQNTTESQPANPPHQGGNKPRKSTRHDKHHGAKQASVKKFNKAFNG